MSENDTALPDGRGCGDCVSFTRCRGLFSCKEENVFCDWAPSRFRGRIVSIEEMTDRICGHLPDGFEIQINMEKGSAWVSLVGEDGVYKTLPDSADKSLIEQLNAALLVANEWI